jgi:thioredoxin-related protein
MNRSFLLGLSSLLVFGLCHAQNSIDARSISGSPLSADEMVQNACKQAAKENKNVLVMFHASWCVWCHRMDSSMNDNSCKKFFDENFVTTHLVVMESKGKENLENPGGLELLAKYNGTNEGIPFWVVLDKDGKLIADCMLRPEGAGPGTKGSNMGCPAKESEVDAFIRILKKTSKITPQLEAAIAKRFRQNEH